MFLALSLLCPHQRCFLGVLSSIKLAVTGNSVSIVHNFEHEYFCVFSTTECEHLIRHMLVKDPNQRYTIEQIKKHKWMQADPAVKTILSYNDDDNFEGDKILDEYNEQALELMHGLGIDIERTKTVKTLSNFSLWEKTATLKIRKNAPAGQESRFEGRESR